MSGDQHARLLSSLSRDRTQDWYAVNLRANEHLNLRVTDRCNLDMPVMVSLLNATATRDLSTAQRFASRSNASQLSIDITETATYLVKVDLGRSLAIDEMSLPYVLHIDRCPPGTCFPALRAGRRGGTRSPLNSIENLTKRHPL